MPEAEAQGDRKLSVASRRQLFSESGGLEPPVTLRHPNAPPITPSDPGDLRWFGAWCSSGCRVAEVAFLRPACLARRGISGIVRRTRMLQLERLNIGSTALVAMSCAGCMPATAGGLAGAPPTICTNMPATPSAAGNVVKCEDFTRVAEGGIPSGWQGGAGLVVQQDPDARHAVLVTNEPRQQYNITIPWSFGGNYRLDASVKACLGLQMAIGNVRLIFDTKPGYAAGYYVGIVRTGVVEKKQGKSDDPHVESEPAPQTWVPVEPYDKSYWGVTLKREGDVHKVTLGSKQILLARYENLPDAESLTITSSCQFGLAGLRVDGAPARPAPGPVASQPPTPATAALAAAEAPAAPTGVISVKADESSEAEFAFDVDGKHVPGKFVSQPGKEVAFTMPAGRVRWAHVNSNCEEGTDAERQFDLKPGDKHAMECWTSNKMGVCCLFGGVGGTPAPR